MDTAGEAGSFMLGNTVGPAGGADIGQLGPVRGGSGCFLVFIGAGFEPFAFSPSFSFSFSSFPSHSQLSSDRAVEGALSTWSAFSFSGSSVSVEALLAALSLLCALLVVLVVLAVLVRFRWDFPVCGGEARHGDTSDIPLRKSK